MATNYEMLFGSPENASRTLAASRLGCVIPRFGTMKCRECMDKTQGKTCQQVVFEWLQEEASD